MNGAAKFKGIGWGFLAAAAAILASGCRPQLLESDQMGIRQSLLDMYQDEVMDNLIRTELRLPVIEVDYRTMTGTVTSLTQGTAGYSQTMTHNSFAITGGTQTPLRQIAAGPTFGALQNQTVQLTLTGEPVCDPTVYDAYEQYLGINIKTGEESAGPETRPTTVPIEASEKTTEPSPVEVAQPLPTNAVYRVELVTPTPPKTMPPPVPRGQLLCSDDRPAEGTYHVCRKFQDKWYYIPPESADAFFALYKRVVLARTSNVSSTQSLGDQLELFRLNQMQQ